MKEPLRILEGLFYESDEGVAVLSDQHSTQLSEFLSPCLGETVELSAHHLPPVPPLPNVEGFGSCLWAGHCPSGHKSNPTWLYNQVLKGVLIQPSPGIIIVGGERLPVEYLVGHLGRLVCFADLKVDASTNVDTLLAEAQDLIKGLESLKSRGSK